MFRNGKAAQLDVFLIQVGFNAAGRDPLLQPQRNDQHNKK